LNRLRSIDTYLLDLDGTFYLGNTLYPWSLPFVNTMKNLGKRFVFVTNNSSQNAKHYLHKIRNMGVDITEDQVFTSGQATIYYLKKHNYPRKLYLVGTPALEEEFQEAGFILTDRDPQTVVLGFDLTLTYEKLKTACSLIREGVPFIATHPDFNCPTEDGFIPDSGAISAFITASTGVTPTYFGKPYKETLEMIIEQTGVSKDKMCIFGDRLYTDIALGRRFGVTSCLVYTGETTPKDVEKASPADRPDYVFPSLFEADEVIFG